MELVNPDTLVLVGTCLPYLVHEQLGYLLLTLTRPDPDPDPDSRRMAFLATSVEALDSASTNSTHINAQSTRIPHEL